MGVERAVTRWYAQRHHITRELAALEAKLLQAQSEEQEPLTEAERVDIKQRLASLHEKLRTLGPCPKPMMG